MLDAAGLFALLFVFLALGVPVSFSLLAAGLTGLLMTSGWSTTLGVLSGAPVEHISSYAITTIPMFVLMGEFLAGGRYMGDLFTFFNRMIGHIRGGLSYGVVGCGVMIAAVTGSSTAASAMLAKTAYPEMRKQGYSVEFSSGALAVVGTLAVLIPPSIALIFYGVFTETSIGALLLAGFAPGVVTAVGYFLTLTLRVRLRPSLAPGVLPRANWRMRLEGAARVWPVLLLMLAIFGALYGGVVTPTEIGAVGAMLALALGLVMGRLGWASILQSVESATVISAMILFIIAAASVFSIALTLTGVTQALLGYIAAAEPNRWVVFGLIVLILIVLGFFMDQLAILALVLPLAFPIISALGFDPVWFGVIVIKTIEIGLITPPLGLNAFVVAGVADVPAKQVFAGTWAFVLTELVILLILILIPSIVTFLPNSAF